MLSLAADNTVHVVEVVSISAVFAVLIVCASVLRYKGKL